MKSSKKTHHGISPRNFIRNTAIKGSAAFAVGAGGFLLPTTAESGQASAKIRGRTVREAARETRVCRTADFVVVGGGPGGIGAALTA